MSLVPEPPQPPQPEGQERPAQKEPEVKPVEKPIGRRTFLRRAAAVAATVGVTALAKNEIKTGIEGVKTDVGVFIPLYESHDIGLNPRDVPYDLDIFFREGVMDEYDFERNPRRILIDILRTKNVAKIAIRLAGNGCKVMLGDVGGTYRERDDSVELELKEGLAGIALFAGNYIHSQTSPDKSEAKTTFSRRNMLKKSLYAASLWAASPFLFDSFTVMVSRGRNNFEYQKDAMLRIVSRINGWLANFHPELTIVFFRNLIMADKMLVVAENEKRVKGRVVKTGFSVGAGHSGIEDLLRAGPDFARALILTYPTDFLRKVVGYAGGIENFCTSRVFTLDPSLTDSDLYDYDKEINQKIQEQKILDQKLMAGLRVKLGEQAAK